MWCDAALCPEPPRDAWTAAPSPKLAFCGWALPVPVEPRVKPAAKPSKKRKRARRPA